MIKNFEKLPNETKSVLILVLNSLNINNPELKIVLDTEYVNNKDENAFFVDTSDEDAFQKVPKESQKYFEGVHNYLIWIPNSIIHDCEQHLMFVFAHECQHYRQVKSSIYKKDAKSFRDVLLQNGLLPKTNLRIGKCWEEFDSDRVAFEEFTKIYSNNEWIKYVEKYSKSEGMQEYFEILLEMLDYWQQYQNSGSIIAPASNKKLM
jgi:hypothetical protein